MKFPMAVIPCVLAMLCSCTGEDGKNDAPATSNVAISPGGTAEHTHFEGNWVGTLTSDQSQQSSTAIALVNGWGEFRLITDGSQFVGWPRRTATSVAGTVTGIRAAGSLWSDGSNSSIFELNGTITADDFIDGAYAGGGESGVFALAWIADTESRIESIAGTWVQYDANQNIVASFQIEPFGTWQARIHGSDANGCTYSGETEAWTSRYSYDVVPVEVSGCPLVAGTDLNGTYSGTGALIEPSGISPDGRALVIALSNDQQRQLTLFLSRVPD